MREALAGFNTAKVNNALWLACADALNALAYFKALNAFRVAQYLHSYQFGAEVRLIV